MHEESVHKQFQSMRISLGRAMSPFLAVVYLIVFALAFKFVLTDYWGYQGYIWNPPLRVLEWALVLAVVLLPLLVLSVSYDRPTRLVLWLLYLVVYIPACVVPPVLEGEVGDYGLFLIMLLTCFLLLVLITELPIPRVQLFELPFNVYLVVLLGLTLFTTVLSLVYYGFPATIPGFADVYEVRSGLRAQGQAVPGFLAYLSAWQYKVVNPLLLAVGIQYRARLPIVAGLLGQLYFYSISGHKSIAFSVVLVIGIWFVTRWFPKVIGPMLLVGTSVIIFASSIATFVGEIMPFSVMVRRLLVVPGTLTRYYVEFFTENSFTLQIDPISRMFFTSPYDLSPPFLIGQRYMESETVSANAHFWAAGFAGFGFLGMVIVTVVLGGILWAMNVMSAKHFPLIGNVVVALSAFSLTNSELFTTIGTHGLGIALVLLLIVPKVRNKPTDEDGTDPQPADSSPSVAR